MKLIFQERLVHLLALGPLKFLQVKENFTWKTDDQKNIKENELNIQKHWKALNNIWTKIHLRNKSDIEGANSCATRNIAGQRQESAQTGRHEVVSLKIFKNKK